MCNLVASAKTLSNPRIVPVAIGGTLSALAPDMTKNKTRFKSLDVVNSDPRVSEVFQDEDGIWLWLNTGWTGDPLSAHDIHEDTVTAILRCYRGIVACECDSCKGLTK